MGKSVFLHIGGEKTGTTTLQHFLRDNAAALRCAGFNYPSEKKNICFEGIGHFPVAAALIGRDVEFVSRLKRRPFTSVARALRKSLEETDGTMLLSCEHFSSRLDQPAQLHALRNALPADKFRIIYYAREPSELALAAWSTHISSGGCEKFDPYKICPHTRYFNHIQILDLWSEVFGPESIIVREYNRERLFRGDIRADFCKLLGVELNSLSMQDDKNLSFDARRLEVLRYINSALPKFDESANGWREVQRIRNIIVSLIPEGPQLQAPIGERERNLIKSRFRETNCALNEKYFAGSLSSKWFPDESSLNALDPVDTKNDVADSLEAVLRDTIIRIAEEATVYQEQLEKKRAGKSKRAAEFPDADWAKEVVKTFEEFLLARSGWSADRRRRAG